jgi:hypothetical protein
MTAPHEHRYTAARYACPARVAVIRDLAAYLATGAIVRVETVSGPITIGPYQPASAAPCYAVIGPDNYAHVCPDAERTAVAALNTVSATAIALYLRRVAMLAA